MFRMIGLGNNIGSGFPTILRAWGEENWRQPDLYDDQELHQVELRLWMVSLMPVECTDYLNNTYGVEYHHLSSEEQIILSTAYLEEKILNSRIQFVLGMRRGRWTTYSINKDYVDQLEQLDLSDIPSYEVELNKTDQQIYQFVKANKIITTQQVVDLVDKISTVQGASVAINRLIDKDLLKKMRQGRHVFYCLK